MLQLCVINNIRFLMMEIFKWYSALTLRVYTTVIIASFWFRTCRLSFVELSLNLMYQSSQRLSKHFVSDFSVFDFAFLIQLHFGFSRCKFVLFCFKLLCVGV